MDQPVLVLNANYEPLNVCEECGSVNTKGDTCLDCGTSGMISFREFVYTTHKETFN